MRAWADYSDGANKKPKREKASYSIDDEILEAITDPVVKALVGQTMAENRKLKRENDLLKTNINLVINMSPKSEPVVNTQSQNVEVSAAMKLLPIEIEALQHAISNEFLQDQAWEMDQNGRIKNKNNRIIFKVGFGTALEKLLKVAQSKELRGIICNQR